MLRNMKISHFARKYENILIWDLNINFDIVKRGDIHSHLSDLCDTCSLSNLLNDISCIKSQNATSIDVMLANRPRRFNNTSLIETGLSHRHKIIVLSLDLSLRGLQLKS